MSILFLKLSVDDICSEYEGRKGSKDHQNDMIFLPVGQVKLDLVYSFTEEKLPEGRSVA